MATQFFPYNILSEHDKETEFKNKNKKIREADILEVVSKGFLTWAANIEKRVDLNRKSPANKEESQENSFLLIHSVFFCFCCVILFPKIVANEKCIKRKKKPRFAAIFCLDFTVG
ncbi:CLUMA_CG014723, isoform A [Clunio marinus]|uniref:CLUMA_CG014723, isoform A n=1 Tax=Clunio marinus TaxID=568069 RepID=A0A1J1IPQ8_9DIPT|nr:CLUMA_CG014723, isoform A [Clunio marinus]